MIAYMRGEGNASDAFEVTSRVKQDCVLAPYAVQFDVLGDADRCLQGNLSWHSNQLQV